MGFFSGAANFLGSMLPGKVGAAFSNRQQIGQAQKQMDFQERMSSTAYQRAVQDMIKAGLNPMLAYSQGGASSPGGAQATLRAPSIEGAQAELHSAQSGVAEESQTLVRAQAEKTQAEKALVEAQTVQSLSSAGHLKASEENIRQEMQAFEQRLANLKSEGALTDQRSAHTSADREKILQERLNLIYQREHIMPGEATRLANQARLLGLQIPEGVRRAAFWESEQGKERPYTDYETYMKTAVPRAARNFAEQYGNSAFKLKNPNYPDYGFR